MHRSSRCSLWMSLFFVACSAGSEEQPPSFDAYTPVLQAGDEDNGFISANSQIKDSFIYKASDGTYHAFASVKTIAGNTSGDSKTDFEVVHKSSSDGKTWVEETWKNGQLPTYDRTDSTIDAFDLAEGITSDEAGNLIAFSRYGMVVWNKQTKEVTTTSFGFTAYGPAGVAMKATPGSFDQASYWFGVVNPYSNSTMLHESAFAAPVRHELSEFSAAGAAFAFDTDLSLHALFLNSGRILGAQPGAGGSSAAVQGGASYSRLDRQSILYMLHKTAPHSTDVTLEQVDLSSLAVVREHFGRDHTGTWLRLLGAELEADGSMAAAFSVSDKYLLFASVVRDAQGHLTLTSPTFLEGRFVAFERFPDTHQPVLFVAADGKLQVLPVEGHRIDQTFVLDQKGDLAPHLESLGAGHLIAEPGRQVSLLLPKEQTELLYLKTGLVSRHRRVAGELAVSLDRLYSPATATFTAPAGGKSYQWCFGDTEECVSGGQTMQHTYAPGATEGFYFATVRVTGGDGGSSFFVRAVTVSPGGSTAALESVAGYTTSSLVGAIGGGRFFYFDASDPVNRVLRIFDGRTGAELGSYGFGATSVGSDTSLAARGDKVWIFFVTRTVVLDVSDPAHPSVAVEYPNVLGNGFFFSVFFLSDSEAVIGNEFRVARFNPLTGQVLAGPFDLPHNRIGLLPGGQLLVRNSSLLRVVAMTEAGLQPLYSFTESEMPASFFTPEPGSAQPVVFFKQDQAGCSMWTPDFANPAAPVMGSPTVLPDGPCTFGYGQRLGGLILSVQLHREVGDVIAVFDVATRRYDELALPRISFFNLRQTDFMSSDGTLLVPYYETDTIDRATLNSFSLENDVSAAHAGQVQMRVYRVVGIP